MKKNIVILSICNANCVCKVKLAVEQIMLGVNIAAACHVVPT